MGEDKLITIAIYTYEKAQVVKEVLEREGIPTIIQNVNLIQPVVSSGVRVRIRETDLPHALQVLEEYQSINKIDDTDESRKDKKVLVPVDFSDYSFKACQIAFNFAKIHQAEVMLLHAYFSPYFPGAIPVTDTFTYEINEDEALKQVQDRVSGEMKSFVDHLQDLMEKGELPKVRFNYILREGIPEDEIYNYSREYKPMLVVMGTRGKNQKELDLIGSVTAEVLDAGHVPILAVPENLSFLSLADAKNVAFFINFDQRELVALDTFMRMMGPYHFKMNFLHISTKRDTWDNIKLAGIKDYFVKHYSGREASSEVIDGEDFLNNVERFICEHHIDILVLTSRKRNIFARLFNPSIAHKMLFHADTPLFVIPS